MNKVRGFFLGFLIFVVYRVLSLTWKIELHEPESLKKSLKEKNPFILAHFHGDELALVSLTPRYKIATMTSTSKDGELMNTVLRLMGGKTSRGSSTRGGVTALKGLIQLCKSGSNCSVAVDGPKGPLHEVKPGIFELSRLMKGQIYAGGVAVDRAWHFSKAWNKTFLPKPFARVVVVWTHFCDSVSKDTDPRSSELANSLKYQIFDAQDQSSKLLSAQA